MEKWGEVRIRISTGPSAWDEKLDLSLKLHITDSVGVFAPNTNRIKLQLTHELFVRNKEPHRGYGKTVMMRHNVT